MSVMLVRRPRRGRFIFGTLSLALSVLAGVSLLVGRGPWALAAVLAGLLFALGYHHVSEREVSARNVAENPQLVFWAHPTVIPAQNRWLFAFTQLHFLMLHLREGRQFEAGLPPDEMRVFIAWLTSPMQKPRFIIAVVMVAIATTAVVFVASLPSRGSVRYHLERLGSMRRLEPFSEPSSFAGYFRPKTWSWYLRGRPGISESVAEMALEQQALIQLGYFERREMTFNHRTWDTQLWSQFHSAISNSTLAEANYMLHLDDNRPSWIQVTTCKADIPVFEEIVKQLDTQTNN